MHVTKAIDVKFSATLESEYRDRSFNWEKGGDNILYIIYTVQLTLSEEQAAIGVTPRRQSVCQPQ
jgi:hypothetical protein